MMYKFTSPSSVEMLLDGLVAYGYARASNGWTPAARTIFLNAVEWAPDAPQGGMAGTVTSGGVAVAGAKVRAVEAARPTITGTDGTYLFGVPDGTYTVAVEALGYSPIERRTRSRSTGRDARRR